MSRSLPLRTSFLVLALALLACAGAASARAEGSHWEIVNKSAPTHLQPNKKGAITVTAVNLGDAPVEGSTANPVVISDTLPAGVVHTAQPTFGSAGVGSEGQHVPKLTCSELRCSWAGLVPPFVTLTMVIPVEAKHAGELGENVVHVEGAKAPSALSRRALSASEARTPFGIESVEVQPEEEDGATDVKAGSHPFQLTTTLEFNTSEWAPDPLFGGGAEGPNASALLRNLDTVLPVGLVADTVGVPQCSAAEFERNRAGSSNACAPDTAIGAVAVSFKEPRNEPFRTEAVPVFNLVPVAGEPARLGFDFDEVPVVLDTSIRTGDGYAAEVTSTNNPQAAEVLGVVLTVWGVPGDARHDNSRGWQCIAERHFVDEFFNEEACPHSGTPKASYLTLPTQCSEPLETSVIAQSWVPGEPSSSAKSAPIPLQGCADLPFSPSIKVTPDRSEASTPSGFNIEIKVPQESTTSPSGFAEADIKQTTMALPEGVDVNPGSADGLETCGTGEAGLLASDGESPASPGDTGSTLGGELQAQRFLDEGVSCPNASKIGEVNISTPLLENELKGNVYLGQQDTNPFASPLVLYLIAHDPVSGVRVKLAGEIQIEPNGQIVSVFKNAPPLPFDALKVHLFDGPRASQTTPAYCRPSTTAAEFVTWSGQEPAPSTSSFSPTSGPNGTPCQTSGPLPFAPTQQAGVENTQAGEFSPFSLTINRPDGDQAIKTITTKLPPGAAAILASVTPCPEPQAADGTCGPESLIGSSIASSGLGSDPYSLPGKVYLTGPYAGAPFGLSSVTEARAGTVGQEKPGASVGDPVFNLGRIVVRSSINVDPYTAAATIDTNASQFFPLSPAPGEQTVFAGLPERLKGIPSQIKTLHVSIDRPNFEFNPTNCGAMEVGGTLTGSEGGSSPVSSHFQTTNCAGLPFQPKLTATVSGQGSKANGVSFNVTVTSPGLHQANIHRVDLTLPKALPSRLETIQKACKVQVFEVNPAACDEGSIIGEGIVHTPVFKNPLRGPAYLVGHAGEEFPDIEFVLQGENVTIVLDGKTFIENGITYSRFETAPDAPFTKFESILPAGPHSALGVDSLITGTARNLCRTPLSMPTEIAGQNGALIKLTTKIATTGCGSVLASKVSRATKLKRALKACKKDKQKAKRAACEKAARKKYGAKPAKKSAKKSSKKS